MFPFQFNTTFEYPLSGDVAQSISPAFFAAMKGVPEIERAVVQDVASYGDQLGALTKVVLELAAKQDLESKALEDLRAISDKVDATKKEVTEGLRDRAEMVLRRLEAADPEAYKDLMGR